MSVKTHKIKKLFKDKVDVKPLFWRPFQYLKLKRFVYQKEYDALRVLEQFNSIVNSQINNINLSEVLKKVIIEELGCIFCALCSVNNYQNNIEVNLISSNSSSVKYNIPLDSSNDELIKILNSQKTVKINKNINNTLNISVDKKVKQVLFIPIRLQNRVKSYICIGLSKNIKLIEGILHLLAQQIGLVIANKDLTSKLKKTISIDTENYLLNHIEFQQELTLEVDKAKELKNTLTLLLMNISSKNKSINTKMDDIEEETIIYIASVLKECVEKNAIIARISHSKLAVILYKGVYQVQLIAKKFIDDINNTNIIDSDSIVINIGISSLPGNSNEKEELLRHADKSLAAAMEQSSHNKKSNIVNYNYLEYVDSRLNIEHSIIADNNDFANELISHLYCMNDLEDNQTLLLQIISSLAAAIDAKDSYIRGHSFAVSKYAEMICQNIGLSYDETEKIRLGALMHDIGKIGVPENVLGKPDRLNENEWEIIKQHPTIGARKIIQPITAFKELVPIVEHHHENWDGSGYPYGLQKDEIPLGARIVSIVDAFHTMTTDRPYRNSLGYNKAVKILQNGSGTQWDSSLIRSFLDISKDAYERVQKNCP
ncbi:MAG: HD domain-containing phosphohydrolase [Cyanobacteriota bacterium]